MFGSDKEILNKSLNMEAKKPSSVHTVSSLYSQDALIAATIIGLLKGLGLSCMGVGTREDCVRNF